MTSEITTWIIGIVVANLGALVTFFVRLNNRIAALEIIVTKEVSRINTDMSRHEGRMDTHEELLRKEIDQLNKQLQEMMNQLNRILGRLESSHKSNK